MRKHKIGCIILIFCLLQAKGIKINSCVPAKQNYSECTTFINIPKGGVKGLRVGPEFVVEGKLIYFQSNK